MITRFYLIPKKCPFLFGSQKTRPSRPAFPVKAQIRQKPGGSGSGPSFAWLQRAGLVGDASLQPQHLPAVVLRVSPNGDSHTPGARGFNPPSEGQRGPAVAEEGPGETPAPSRWPQHHLSQLLARAGAAVAPGQLATTRWKEEETALFCPKPRN